MPEVEEREKRSLGLDKLEEYLVSRVDEARRGGHSWTSPGYCGLLIGTMRVEEAERVIEAIRGDAADEIMKEYEGLGQMSEADAARAGRVYGRTWLESWQWHSGRMDRSLAAANVSHTFGSGMTNVEGPRAMEGFKRTRLNWLVPVGAYCVSRGTRQKGTERQGSGSGEPER